MFPLNFDIVGQLIDDNYNNNHSDSYLTNDSYRKDERHSPIFFYTGNEGDIELFAQNTGFMWDIAKEFKATLGT